MPHAVSPMSFSEESPHTDTERDVSSGCLEVVPCHHGDIDMTSTGATTHNTDSALQLAHNNNSHYGPYLQHNGNYTEIQPAINSELKHYSKSTTEFQP